MAGSLSEERGPLTSGSPLLIHTHTTHATSGMPTHYFPFSPFSPFPSSMLSSPAVLIRQPSQEPSYPSGQTRLQLGRERDGGVGARKGNGKSRKENER